jgi:hypothetical protein
MAWSLADAPRVIPDVTRAVVGQLDVYWWGLRSRLEGLTDDEFFWKPVPAAFCLTARGDDLYYEWPPGSRGEATPPVTTIAWRLSHVAQGCFMNRWRTYFGDGQIDWTTEPFPTTAAGALDYLDEWKQRWVDGVTEVLNDGLWRCIGDREGDTAVMQLGELDPFVGLVMHMNREVMHHGGEICLLRDLYRASNS